ncbi:hypothetical protein [Halocalculus aciditolerans]|uniref:Uncharacterized protein n=1 Tax=Halocalculus aciditolerans TaxID=1383812 RepID=A0A830FH36_9EURY|nr:hypothetical protein [Halocalculus aciditolerans]GGL54657.1 hypothetical protein GCM10009039_10950 [Halocalculus aciditolerans]
MASLTIDCPCGERLDTDDADELDGITHCDCGATYVYALTQLRAGDPTDDARHTDDARPANDARPTAEDD